MKELKNLRVDYSGDLIDIKKLKNNPIKQFEIWFKNAKKENIIEPNAMILSTISKNNLLNSRTVLLKNITDKGLVFFTNYESIKANDIMHNNNVSVVFLWKKIERQVIIKGKAVKITKRDSKKYFDSRPEKSKIAAWASKQSKELHNSSDLLKRFKNFENKFKNKLIPYPDFWGGYIIHPNSIEFWQGRSSRMHDRILYEKEKNKWNINRLYP
ncbi:MAG TPA: pyridoxamine 5'-phosphate oxidase [Cytophagales bacterium]|jgi:pyridoxamine 5'-phosphate oxidase|nr:pyridoxamine 5'-phosphate oxidase [Cytophagales bacterium]